MSKKPAAKVTKAGKKAAKPAAPVQVPAQHKGAAFLAALADTGIILRACELTKTPRANVYFWRKDADFEARFQLAVDEATERLELEARRRAFEGTDKPVYQGGQLVGYVREYSDTLLIFTLKALKPDKYRDNAKVEHTGKDGAALAPAVVVVPATAADMESWQAKHSPKGS